MSARGTTRLNEAAWCAALVHELSLAAASPSTARVRTVRTLIEHPPETYLLGEWRDLAAAAAAWVAAAESAMPAFGGARLIEAAKRAKAAPVMAWAKAGIER